MKQKEKIRDRKRPEERKKERKKERKTREEVELVNIEDRKIQDKMATK